MEIVFTHQAVKDFDKIKANKNLLVKAKHLLELLVKDPFASPPSYEKLIGIANTYSRRINLQHRLVYQVYAEEKIVKVIRMWTHYE